MQMVGILHSVDPNAHDAYAEDKSDVDLAWNLGHLIVHVTASSEESAALAAEMARGVKRDGRSRSELPWETVTTVEQCRERLEESRRMRLVSLDMWPDAPYLDNKVTPWSSIGEIDGYGRFILGLAHDEHLAQIEDVIAQAKAARGAMFVDWANLCRLAQSHFFTAFSNRQTYSAQLLPPPLQTRRRPA